MPYALGERLRSPDTFRSVKNGATNVIHSMEPIMTPPKHAGTVFVPVA
jgi:hypothetical protein